MPQPRGSRPGKSALKPAQAPCPSAGRMRFLSGQPGPRALSCRPTAPGPNAVARPVPGTGQPRSDVSWTSAESGAEVSPTGPAPLPGPRRSGAACRGGGGTEGGPGRAVSWQLHPAPTPPPAPPTAARTAP